MNKKQYEELCYYLDKLAERLAELKGDFMKLKYPPLSNPPLREEENKKEKEKEKEGKYI